LGAALREVFPDADAEPRDVTEAIDARPDLILHAAAWTDVDGAESEPERARRVNVEGARNVVALGAPVVYFSTDYVFDGTKGEPYVESDEPNPLSVYGRTKLEGEREIRDGWVVRSSWLFGSTGKNFVRTMLDLGRQQD
jgi:dTDP-4-dehydrorhamnose reductase